MKESTSSSTKRSRSTARSTDARQEVHASSGTAVAAESLRTGVPPAVAAHRRVPIPGDSETTQPGDPDDRSLANEIVGEETPDGTLPTPDQNDVDDMGRAYGLQEGDTGALHSVAEVLGRRDRHRSELRAPNRSRR
jgi:Family of unknown function (DUF6335)